MANVDPVSICSYFYHHRYCVSEAVLVWTGLKKGPPRKLKFPESEVVIKEIKEKLSLE